MNVNEDSSFTHNKKLKISRWKLLGVIFISSFLIVLYVDNVVRVNKIFQKIRQVQKKMELLNDKNEIYQRKIISLQSPDRILQIAKKKLNMIEIDSVPDVIYLEDE